MAKAGTSQRHQTLRATPAHDGAVSRQGGMCHDSPEVLMGVEVFAVSDRGGSADGRDNPMCGKQELREAFFVVGKTRVTCGFAALPKKKMKYSPTS